MGNHCMGVVSDSESYEKCLIFGGISNQVGSSIEQISSSLSNKAYLITLNCRNQAKSLFKAEEKQDRKGSTLNRYKKSSQAVTVGTT